jgi:hypothetical protein
MGAGVGVRLVSGADPHGGGEHDRGEQHHGGVQTQHRRDRRGDHEHHQQQPLWSAPAGASHQRARIAEQSLVVAELRQDQHRRKKSHHWRQPRHLRLGLRQRDRFDHHEQHRSRDRDDDLGPAPRPRHRETQHHQQQDHRDGLGDRRTQDKPLPFRCSLGRLRLSRFVGLARSDTLTGGNRPRTRVLAAADAAISRPVLGRPDRSQAPSTNHSEAGEFGQVENAEPIPVGNEVEGRTPLPTDP